MKKIFWFPLLLLAACHSHEKNVDRAQTDDGEQTLVDKGSVPLPGRPGYTLHRYTNAVGILARHEIYIIEREGVPIGGADATYVRGKTSASTSVQ